MFRDPFPIFLTDDLAAITAFYRDLLGFGEAYRFPPSPLDDPEFVVLSLGPAQFGFGRAGSVPLHGRMRSLETGNRVEVCVYTDNVDLAVDFLREAGTPVLSEPVDQPWGERAAYVADPDGNPVLIVARI
ncbi:MAG: glyoxalase/bleomycin resistance/dioxygenase family protein [Hamadaea sp.]|uniref:VOC family protein n=1 Tax=Hamadaea sp. TaxID=2024425 RepID=UPI00181CA022|nr:VOC family protein [Hamadaea sp.]NUR72733.1 glyoxalase/bleomycin resistance/dioxygenase family protein [Hamadaea sp.]NUT18433.1 glyoxalase/bleomycin resistance/dioxygenase family protein [Hamadaea sp.]